MFKWNADRSTDFYPVWILGIFFHLLNIILRQNKTRAKYYSIWHKRYIENFQQTEVSHLKIIKTIKLTIAKQPGTATTQPLDFFL